MRATIVMSFLFVCLVGRQLDPFPEGASASEVGGALWEFVCLVGMVLVAAYGGSPGSDDGGDARGPREALILMARKFGIRVESMNALGLVVRGSGSHDMLEEDEG